MPFTINGTTISVNNGPSVPGSLDVEQHTETVYSDIAVKPDPSWETVDGNGHFHAFDVDGELPTLEPRGRHVECDGPSCGGQCGGEGYEVTDYFCRICGEQVEPGYVPDREPRIIPTYKTWTVTVEQAVQQREQVTVRVTLDDRVMFGIATAGSFTATSDRDGVRTITTLYGVGPLGMRKRSRQAVTTGR